MPVGTLGIAGNGEGGGVSAGIAAVAAVLAECNFNIDKLWWFKYLDLSGRRLKAHNEFFIEKVTVVTESNVTWIWMDNNNEESLTTW